MGDVFSVLSVPRSYKQGDLVAHRLLIVVFLGPRANVELVPKFHVALHASHAALQY
jgi:hypothetical protein